MDEIAIEKNKVKYAEWNAMVEACQSSGLTVRTWCEYGGVIAPANR